MNRVISVPAHENGVVRVFALSMSDADAKALKANIAENGAPSPQELALGSDTINDAHVEVFALSDLGDMSLPGYLAEGAGACPADMDRDRHKLAALEGWVMIVYSSAFTGQAQDITPSAQLTLIGTYTQEEIDWTAPVDLSTPSAQPYSGAPPEKKRPSDAAMSGRIAILALLVAFFVVGLMFWVGS